MGDGGTGQQNFQKNNAENVRGIQFFPDDDSGENSCNTANQLSEFIYKLLPSNHIQ